LSAATAPVETSIAHSKYSTMLLSGLIVFISISFLFAFSLPS
jgi:hypothetical protein